MLRLWSGLLRWDFGHGLRGTASDSTADRLGCCCLGGAQSGAAPVEHRKLRKAQNVREILNRSKDERGQKCPQVFNHIFV